MILKLPSPPYIIVCKSRSTLAVTIIYRDTLQNLIHKQNIHCMNTTNGLSFITALF